MVVVMMLVSLDELPLGLQACDFCLDIPLTPSVAHESQWSNSDFFAVLSWRGFVYNWRSRCRRCGVAAMTTHRRCFPDKPCLLKDLNRGRWWRRGCCSDIDWRWCWGGRWWYIHRRRRRWCINRRRRRWRINRYWSRWRWWCGCNYFCPALFHNVASLGPSGDYFKFRLFVVFTQLQKIVNVLLAQCLLNNDSVALICVNNRHSWATTIAGLPLLQMGIPNRSTHASIQACRGSLSFPSLGIRSLP